MNERFIRVPVSLLRRWEDHYSHRIPAEFYDELLALLEEPEGGEDPLSRVLRRVGEMVEGYEAGGSIAAQMQIIRDEWRRYQNLPPR